MARSRSVYAYTVTGRTSGRTPQRGGRRSGGAVSCGEHVGGEVGPDLVVAGFARWRVRHAGDACGLPGVHEDQFGSPQGGLTGRPADDSSSLPVPATVGRQRANQRLG
ncbi:MAG TPA: hypothetical protein VLH10_00335 [Yinghuangia sp.]|uniref:hypothetical protein n=1 Tax=Yinghuangia sp. YIM S10712 TaxID=3436930 RepID=UPI002BEF0DE9|nr:hypothetical protein [Yinghuangia sp.]